MNRAMSWAVVAAVIAVAVPAQADYEAGLKAYNSTHYDKALAEWQPLAEAGDPQAQFGMGQLYANGFGVEMEDARALHWFGLAAEQGHPDAQFRLAVMHQNGWGVPMDDEAAAVWYEKAAEQGLTEAQVALGQVYAAEYCALYDPLQAYKWFSIAADLGDVNAAEKRDRVAAMLSAAELEQAEAMAAEWSSGHAALFANQP